jgi:hypothetical protein
MCARISMYIYVYIHMYGQLQSESQLYHENLVSLLNYDMSYTLTNPVHPKSKFHFGTLSEA